MNIIKKRALQKVLCLALPLLAVSTESLSAGNRGHQGHTEHGAHEDHKENSVSIAPDMAQKLGIETAIAGPGEIERHLQVYGRLVTPPDQHVHIRARFPGIVREVRVNVGDRVKKDQILAVIESNQSLQTYQVRSPIEAVVQSRMTNVGEITGEASLFTLVNNDRLWAELKVFPGQRFEVNVGQDVHISHNNHTHEGQIATVTPASGEEPFVLARVSLPNRDGDMAPGDLVSGQIDAEKVKVPLLVDNRALQTVHDQTVVFVVNDEVYQAHPVELGRSDGDRSEVLSGLHPGDRYVVQNSYLIKADLLKSGASHHH